MNQGKTNKQTEDSTKGFAIGMLGLFIIALIIIIMNSITTKLYKNGVHVGVQYQEPGPNGNIEIWHKNTPEAEDTRREKFPIFESGIVYDSMEIVELKTVDR